MLLLVCYLYFLCCIASLSIENRASTYKTNTQLHTKESEIIIYTEYSKYMKLKDRKLTFLFEK